MEDTVVLWYSRFKFICLVKKRYLRNVDIFKTWIMSFSGCTVTCICLSYDM